MPDKFEVGCAAGLMLVVVVLHITKGLPLGWGFLFVLLILPAVGILVSLDPQEEDGPEMPEQSGVALLPMSYLWGNLSARLAVSMAGFALDAGPITSGGLRFWYAAASMSFVAIGLLSRKRLWLVGFLLILAAIST